jgi:hemolysin III
MDHGEKFNTWTHLAGAVLALAGSVVLIVKGALSGDAWKIVSFSIYGATLVLLYSFSTLYHNAARGRMKRFLQKLDHNAIYLLIAGSYTPFTLVSLRGPWGWSLFGVVWGLALLGIFQEIWLKRKTRIVSLVIYILMGWVALIAVVPLVNTLMWAGFAWLAAGGVAYTAGIVFFVNDEKFRHWHGIWHLFVLAGSALHYCAILLYVA